MKYIRTKDELGIEKKDGTCCFETWSAGSSSPLKKDWLYADNIEELCDEFIIKVQDTKSKEYGYLIIDKLGGYEKVLSLNKQAQENGAIIYGAIWTDKGLIYVAKMNEKGELELL